MRLKYLILSTVFQLLSTILRLKKWITQAPELSKYDYEDSINNIPKQNEYELRVMRKKHENELGDNKNYNKNVI